MVKLELSEKTFLVGYTGFVGSNLYEQYKFDKVFNSKNITEAFDENPDLLVYSGIPAQKFIANSNPEEDKKIIDNAILNIKKIGPKKIVLISTIDVYSKPYDVNEDTPITENEEAYGRNRRFLEEWVQNNFEDYLIVRLPGLYGKNLKKNFIYDLINYIPSLLKSEKFNELCEINPDLSNYYLKQDNDFYKCKELNIDEKNKLKEIFKDLNFSALNFTDSRGSFQFYNLKYLWNHIQIALQNNIKLLNLATEPITVSELYKYIFNQVFKNELNGNIPDYNYKTKYAKIFNGKNDYIFTKEFILEDIKEFVESYNSYDNKLCISNIAWDTKDTQEIYQFLKSKNIKHLEIAPTKLVGENPYDKIEEAVKISKDLKKDYNIKIDSIQSMWYGKTENIFTSKENQKLLISYTKKAIDFASAINCRNIVFGNPKNRNMTDYDKNYPIAVDFFKEIGDYAKEKDVIIAIEPNPIIYSTNFLNTTEEAVNFVKELNCSHLKVNCDLGTIIENKEELTIVADNIKYINHIHISEPNLAIIENRDLHKELFELLQKCNYTNLVSIEMKQCDIKDIKKTIEYVENVYWSVYGK